MKRVSRRDREAVWAEHYGEAIAPVMLLERGASVLQASQRWVLRPPEYFEAAHTAWVEWCTAFVMGETLPPTPNTQRIAKARERRAGHIDIELLDPPHLIGVAKVMRAEKEAREADDADPRGPLVDLGGGLHGRVKVIEVKSVEALAGILAKLGAGTL